MANIFDEPFASLYNKVPRKDVAPGKKQVADFHFHKTIGEGSFAVVMKVTEKSTSRDYAMKILEKNQVRKQNLSGRVVRERDIICSLDNPFVIQLYCTFQTESHLFFCLTLASNGCLLDLLLKYGSFTVEVSRFYTAELVHVLEYLHSKRVIHRDVKPENLLLDSNMHIKVTDFGTAVKLSDENPRPKSFVGTAQYVSPELLGLTEDEPKYTCKESDLWAVGCIVYQYIAGTSPFDGPQHEWGIFQKIKKCDYSFDEGFPEAEKDFVERLLVLNPDERLGSITSGGISELKKHKIFEDIKSWDMLHETMAPKVGPHLPSSGSIGSENQSIVDIQDFDKINITAPKKLVDNRQSLLSKQAQSEPKLNKHLNGNELIIKHGIIHKRRGLSRKKRCLILTDYPSLYYIDPMSNMMKGEVSWENGFRVQQKNKKIFYVHTPDRIYYLECTEGNAEEWCGKINEVIEIVKSRKS